MRILKIVSSTLAIGLVAVLVAGCGKEAATTTITYQDVAVEKGDITLQITSTGTLEYADQQNLSFETNGNVGEINVEVGDLIKKGDVLATLDAAERADQIEALEKAVKNAQNAVTAADNDIVKKQRLIAGKELAVTDAELNLRTVENSLNNITEVKEAKDALDAIELKIKIAEANMLAAGAEGNTAAVNYYRDLINGTGTPLQGGLKQAQTEAQKNYNDVAAGVNVTSDVKLQIEKAQLQIKQAQRTLDEAKIAVDDAKSAVADAELTRTETQQSVVDAQDALDEANVASIEIKAPFDGVVISIAATKGNAAKKGATAMVVADTTKFEATMLVNEMDIPEIGIGTRATIEPSSMSGVSLSATVTKIAPVATSQSGVVSYKVTAELAPLTSQLTRPATTATAEEKAATQKKLEDALNNAVASGKITQEQADQLRTRLQSMIVSLTDEQLNQLIQNAGQSTSERVPGQGPGGGFLGQGAGGNLTQEQLDQIRQQMESGGTIIQRSNAIATDVQLRQGLSLTVNLIQQQKLDVLVVPNSAVKTQSGKSYVQVRNSVGELEQREVTIGLKDYTNTEIVSGLSEGDVVIITKTTSTNTTNSTSKPQQGFGIGGGILR